MKILITGGAGSIGSNLVKKLVRSNLKNCFFKSITDLLFKYK